MRTVHVFVTDADILAGIPECSDDCPIALACQRVGLNKASYDLSDLTFVVEEQDASVYLGQKCQEFAVAFDHRESVAPFDFVIEVPESQDLEFTDDEEDDGEDQP